PPVRSFVSARPCGDAVIDLPSPAEQEREEGRALRRLAVLLLLLLRLAVGLAEPAEHLLLLLLLRLLLHAGDARLARGGRPGRAR
ncbi:hypothetical protein, partial [Rhodoplanes roseus]|uniref:hypothetical protein n=1 Tax=Rhodoplanes roseus TaxID=29409 RepID=UPI001AECE40F